MKRLKTLVANHDEAVLIICGVLTLAIAAASVYGYVTYRSKTAKAQAVNRAKKMNGRTFTITNVAFNFLGDTKLILENEDGQDAGWILMQTTNPLNGKINPFFLAFTDPFGRIPLPMKVKARYRESPWTDEETGKTYDQITASFVEFEQVN